MKTLHVNTTVTILGTTWTVRSATEQEEPRMIGISGFTDWTTKTICVDKNATGNLGKFEDFMQKVIRHEVVHAFMFESGLGDSFEHKDFGHEETIVDWIAYHMENIMSVIKDIQNEVKWKESETE